MPRLSHLDVWGATDIAQLHGTRSIWYFYINGIPWNAMSLEFSNEIAWLLLLLILAFLDCSLFSFQKGVSHLCTLFLFFLEYPSLSSPVAKFPSYSKTQLRWLLAILGFSNSSFTLQRGITHFIITFYYWYLFICLSLLLSSQILGRRLRVHILPSIRLSKSLLIWAGNILYGRGCNWLLWALWISFCGSCVLPCRQCRDIRIGAGWVVGDKMDWAMLKKNEATSNKRTI